MGYIVSHVIGFYPAQNYICVYEGKYPSMYPLHHGYSLQIDRMLLSSYTHGVYTGPYTIVTEGRRHFALFDPIHITCETIVEEMGAMRILVRTSGDDWTPPSTHIRQHMPMQRAKLTVKAQIIIVCIALVCTLLLFIPFIALIIMYAN